MPKEEDMLPKKGKCKMKYLIKPMQIYPIHNT